jgi:DNA (cytosine-5)-methyltransferase 3A
MRKADQEVITELLGVKPVRINSKVASPQLRNRLYWTNIPWEVEDLNSLEAENLNDILDEGWSDREKARCLLESDSRPLTTPLKMFHRYYSTGFTTLIFKDEAHYHLCKAHYDKYYKGLSAKEIDSLLSTNTINNSVYNGVRYLNQNELERCQSVPENYTECVSRDEAASLLGDGWTVDVIARFFKNLK